MAGEKSVRSEKLMTPEFRVSFPYVFEPSKNMADPTKPGKYAVTMLFQKGADLREMQKAVADVVVQKFGPDKAKWPRLRLPFRDQADKADKFKGYEPGAVFVTATSKDRPGLVDASVTKIINPEDFYAGCYARATVNAYYYDQAGNKGVAFGLMNIQKTKDGEPLGDRANAEADFQPVEAPAGASGNYTSLDALFGTN